MSLNVVRLRNWLALAGLLLLAVVAGFYWYGRLRMQRALKAVPAKLGINIQQSTQGFVFSSSQKGRTIFTIRASKAIQYKAGGKATLRDVNIVVYGQRSDRFDQIYGSDFEYDPQSGDVMAKGEVHIDLEGNAQGPVGPDQAPPQELKNPIHLQTSGLVFNRNTGLARTSQKIEFRVPQASGEAMGAVYDSKAAILTLISEVHVHSNQPDQSDIRAQHGVISRGPSRAVLDDVSMERPGSSFRTKQLIIYFRDDNSVEHLVAAGDVQAQAQGKSNLKLAAPKADVWITAADEIRQAVLSGGVTWDASGQSNLAGNAGKVTLGFAGKHLLQKVTAGDGVKLVQRPAQASAQAHTVEISAAAIDFLVSNGRVLDKAITSGPAQVAILPASSADAQRTVATAGHFEAAFDRQNRLKQVVGMPDVRVVASDPGQPDKTSTSQRLDVAFNPNGGIASLLQEGDFHFEEGQRTAAANAGGRSAWAERARYTPSDQVLLLTGSPRIVEGGMTTTAQRVQFNRRTGDASAEGDVKTTYSELKPQVGGALLATSEPIHVTAKLMNARQTGGTAVFSGGSRLWQGSSIVQAPALEFDRGHRTLLARGGPGEHVSTVFVQQDKNGKLTPVNLEAASLSYSDMQRTAHFEGGVVAKSGDMTLTADKVDVILQAKGQTAVAPTTSTPSQVERIVADGHVNVQEPNRKAVGDQLVYTASDGRFRLTGGPPSIFDAERGKITGDSLTFFSHDDRVLVESKGTSPTVTQTRVAK